MSEVRPWQRSLARCLVVQSFVSRIEPAIWEVFCKPTLESWGIEHAGASRQEERMPTENETGPQPPDVESFKTTVDEVVKVCDETIAQIMKVVSMDIDGVKQGLDMMIAAADSKGEVGHVLLALRKTIDRQTEAISEIRSFQRQAIRAALGSFALKLHTVSTTVRPEG